LSTKRVRKRPKKGDKGAGKKRAFGREKTWKPTYWNSPLHSEKPNKKKAKKEGGD